MRTIVAPLRLLRRMSFRELVAPVIRGLISLAKVASDHIEPLLRKVVDVRRIALRAEYRGVVGNRYRFKAVGDEIVQTLIADDLPFVGLTFR
jgi:hypothetical protein